MPASTARAEQLTDFVDLEFARRLEMAEMIFPDCEAALRAYSPSDPIASLSIAGGIGFFGGAELSRQPDGRFGIVWRGDGRTVG